MPTHTFRRATPTDEQVRRCLPRGTAFVLDRSLVPADQIMIFLEPTGVPRQDTNMRIMLSESLADLGWEYVDSTP